MFSKEIKRENRMLKHNNQILVEKNNLLIKTIMKISDETRKQQFGSVTNFQNKIRKTLADLDTELKSI